MAAPASVNQVTQLGVETTYGSLPAGGANRRIPTWSVTPNSRIETQAFTAQGFKNATSRVLNKLWAQGTHGGPLDYNSFLYVIASLVGVTGPVGAGAAKTWSFAPNTSGADSNAKTFAVQRGEGSAAQQFLGTKVTSLTMTATQDGANVSGNVVARFPTDGVTLTASPTDIPERPVLRGHVNVFIDSAFGSIGGTKLTDVYEEELVVGDKDVPFWVHNTDYPSFKELVEQAHDLSFRFKTAHNAQSRAQFNLIASNPTQYLRWMATGADEIETGVFERIRLNVAGKFTQAEPMYSDQGAVYGYQYTYGLLHDASMGGAWSGDIINRLTTL